MQVNPQLLIDAVQRYKRLQVLECYDPINPDSRPTPAQLEVLRDINHISHRYVTSGNQSGKSQLGARECVWVLTETHPFWKRRPEWGDEPLQLLVIGRVTKQVEEVLWRKISGFLDLDQCHIQRVGGVIQKVTYKPTGNTIIFLSHHNEREAREKAQAYTASWVWIDELPSNVRLLEELHRRIQAKRGYFLATFTPKTPNKEIKELVDNGKAPVSRKYQFAMLDNPIYSEEQKRDILASLETYPEAYRRTILLGDWYAGDSKVYQFDDNMVEAPEGYHAGWRHVESSDPAVSSKFGFTVWAENPSTGVWYLIRADYISGIPVPSDIFKEVQRRLAGLNVVSRICDGHESWWVGTAAGEGVHYTSPYSKNTRKAELIKNLQQALSDGKLKVAPWCTDFIKEIESCQWSETADRKIVNSSSYHLLDASTYMVDCRPKGVTVKPALSWEAELRAGNEARKKAEARQAQMNTRRRTTWKLRRSY